MQHPHGLRRVLDYQPSAQPRPITSALQTEVECARGRPRAAASRRAFLVMAACTWILSLATSFHTVTGEYSPASHQLSHASSRQRFKLNGHRSLVTMRQLATGTKHECNAGRNTPDDAPLAMTQLTGMQLTVIESAAVERPLGCVAERLRRLLVAVILGCG